MCRVRYDWARILAEARLISMGHKCILLKPCRIKIEIVLDVHKVPNVQLNGHIICDHSRVAWDGKYSAGRGWGLFFVLGVNLNCCNVDAFLYIILYAKRFVYSRGWFSHLIWICHSARSHQRPQYYLKKSMVKFYQSSFCGDMLISPVPGRNV